MKKVIFIGGTSYSGSTFFDMILANDPKGFSCGEVDALFRPYRPNHIQPECGCGVMTCDTWKNILAPGEKRLYQTIFELFPAINFIIDSSKNPFWYQYHTNLLRKYGVAYENILIWKTPLELAYSFKKRNKLKNWENSWINYHRLYFTLVKNWKSVRYRDLTNDITVLKNLCCHLQIPYFAGKEKFWQKEMHTLFGNASAKLHLFSRKSKNFDRVKNHMINSSNNKESEIIKNYQHIYYNEVNDDDLKRFVNDRMAGNNYFSKILTILTENDLARMSCNNRNLEKIKFNLFQVNVRKIKYFSLLHTSSTDT